MNPVIENIRKRRSIRKYKDKKVPKEIIETLLECAVLAPSAMHVFPWNFVVIENGEKIKELSEKVVEKMKLEGKEPKRAREDPIFYSAPLLVIISCDKEVKWRKEDTALALENMFLAAESLGLGSCWIGYAHRLNYFPEVLEELGISKNQEITGIAIFGYPDEKKETPERKAKVVKWIK